MNETYHCYTLRVYGLPELYLWRVCTCVCFVTSFITQKPVWHIIPKWRLEIKILLLWSVVCVSGSQPFFCPNPHCPDKLSSPPLWQHHTHHVQDCLIWMDYKMAVTVLHWWCKVNKKAAGSKEQLWRMSDCKKSGRRPRGGPKRLACLPGKQNHRISTAWKTDLTRATLWVARNPVESKYRNQASYFNCLLHLASNFSFIFLHRF